MDLDPPTLYGAHEASCHVREVDIPLRPIPIKQGHANLSCRPIYSFYSITPTSSTAGVAAASSRAVSTAPRLLVERGGSTGVYGTHGEHRAEGNADDDGYRSCFHHLQYNSGGC